MIKKVKHTLMNQLTQGASPEKLSQSLSAGILIGIFPLLGFTTALAALVGVLFKLNHIVVQTTHYMLYPLQIIMIPVYVKLIGYMINVGDVPVRPDLIIEAFHRDWLGFFKKYALVGGYAVLLWLIVSSILFFVLAKLFLPAIQRLSKLKG